MDEKRRKEKMRTVDFAAFSEQDRRCTELFFPEPSRFGRVGDDTFGDRGLLGNQMSSIVLLENGQYRIYLTRRVWRESVPPILETGYADLGCLCAGAPLEENFSPLKYANLPDGIATSQPTVLRRQGQFELFVWIYGRGMIRYVKGHSPDGICFFIENLESPCLYHPSDSAVRQSAATDGLLTVADGLTRRSVSVPAELLRLRSNDATTVVCDGKSGEYRMFSVSLLSMAETPERRIAYDNAPGWMRVIHRRISSDGLHWSPPEVVLAPDRLDPVDLQFYALNQLDTERGMVGVAGYYRVAAQTIDCLPVISFDGGRRVQRPLQPWQLRGVSEDPSVKLLFPGGIFQQEDEIVWCATAFHYLHNESGKLPPAAHRNSIMLYRQPLARWCGLAVAAGETSARLLTPPICWRHCRLEAENPERSRVVLCDVTGKPRREVTPAPNGEIALEPAEWKRLEIHFTHPVYQLQLLEE